MSFLRNLWSDLVEKKLWPVAIALVLALVAVPLVISSGGAEEAAAPLPGEGASAAAGVTAAQVALMPGTPVRLDRAGKQRNPFKQQHVPKAAATGTTGVVSASGSALAAAADAVKAAQAVSGGGGQASTPTTTGQATTPPPATTPAKPSPSKDDTIQEAFTVVLNVNQVGNDPVRRQVGRLTPLPSAATPYFVYLGVLKDRRTAVFLLSSEVKADGEGTCRPKGTDCQTVELEAGDREVFDVLAGDGSVERRYEVRLARVEKDGVPTKAKAAKVSAKQRATTKAAAKAALASSGNDRYLVDGDTGLLQRTSSHFRAKKLTKAEARARAVKALVLGISR